MSSNPSVKEFIASKASSAQDDQLRQNYTQMKDLYDKK